jgi:alpha-tubulin suppressor-like RCC1 family protein
VGWNYYGQCNVGDWTDIVQVAAGVVHTVGLRSDSTVIAVGYNDYGQCTVSGWTDIKQVPAGEYYHTIVAGFGHTVGLKTDGTVVAAGPEVELAKWNLVLAVPPSEIPPVNWLLIGGVIGAAVATGLVIFFVRKKRLARTKGR